MRHRPRLVGALSVVALLVTTAGAARASPEPAPADTGHVSLTVTGLRSTKGRVMACLTARPDAFPDCAKDPQARLASAPAAAANIHLEFGAVPPGRYAISAFHDENGNGRLDKSLMIPREGYGFSRDAPVRFGPPSFASAAFAVIAGDQQQSLRMRYMF